MNGTRLRRGVRQRYWGRLRLIVLKLLRLRDTPGSIAWGMAWGFFVGMTPTMGAQMYIAALSAPLVRANIFSAVLAVWITNPWTFLPIYYANYRCGIWLLFMDPLSYDEIRETIMIITANLITSPTTAWHNGFMKLGNHLWPLLLGCLVVGVLGMAPVFFATYGTVVYYRRQRELRRLARRLRQSRENNDV